MKGSKTTTSEWHAGQFTIADYFDKPVHGYSNGQHWNGWEKPYFEKEEADRIAATFGDIQYEAEKDAYIWPQAEPDEPADVFDAVTIEIDGRVKRLYGIGAGYWTWEKVMPA